MLEQFPQTKTEWTASLIFSLAGALAAGLVVAVLVIFAVMLFAKTDLAWNMTKGEVAWLVFFPGMPLAVLCGLVVSALVFRTIRRR